MPTSAEEIRAAVRQRFAQVARLPDQERKFPVGPASAKKLGYDPKEIDAFPPSVTESFCGVGNPLGLGEVRPGQVVLDLGSGAGLDSLLAARWVGLTGRAIGIDMTTEMLDLAGKNAARGNGGRGFPNVEFHQATIDRLPLPDASVDCVISNWVINLAPDKPAVFQEVARVLKPGGRLAVSDIALKKPLSAEIGEDLMAYAGCIARAVLIDEYRRLLARAEFAAVEVIGTGADLNAYTKVENQTGCCSPPASSLPVAEAVCCSSGPKDEGLHRRLLDLLTRYNVNDYAASVRVFAVKP